MKEQTAKTIKNLGQLIAKYEQLNQELQQLLNQLKKGKQSASLHPQNLKRRQAR